MIYRLEFLPSADKEWKKLGATVRQQFQNKLQERLARPRVPKDALSDYPDHYKIKLRSAGYRLIYRVIDQTITVVVVRIGKREQGKVYLKIPRD
jgi:mRNA interferase RelE/StbE